MYTMYVGCWPEIQHRKHLFKGNVDCFADIYDGGVYQEHVRTGFLCDGNNISFTVNTDGIPVFRSSSFSFWPIWLFVNELPYRMRYVHFVANMMCV